MPKKKKGAGVNKRASDGEMLVSPKKPAFRHLTDEEIEEIASKDWKSRDHSVYADKGKGKSIRNLSGPKTEEGKKNSLKNLRPNIGHGDKLRASHGGYIREVLNNREKEFFEERKAKYVEDFDLNESSDEVVLNMCLMEEVIWYRLMLYQAEHPSADIERPLNDCHKRLMQSMKSLGVLREQRVGRNININSSLAELAARVAKELDTDSQRLAEMEAEEEILMRKKKKNIEGTDEFDIIYEAIDDDDVDLDD